MNILPTTSVTELLKISHSPFQPLPLHPMPFGSRMGLRGGVGSPVHEATGEVTEELQLGGHFGRAMSVGGAVRQ